MGHMFSLVLHLPSKAQMFEYSIVITMKQSAGVLQYSRRNSMLLYIATEKSQGIFLSKPARLNEEPENTIRDVDIVVLMLPRSAHQLYFETLRPHIKPGAIIVGLPGYPGFDREVRHILGDIGRQCTIMNFESEPWLCGIIEFGVTCEVLGTKEELLGTMKVQKMLLNAGGKY